MPVLCEKRDTDVCPWLGSGTWPNRQPGHTNPCKLCREKQHFYASYPPTFSLSHSPWLPLGSSIPGSNKHPNSFVRSCTPDLDATPSSPSTDTTSPLGRTAASHKHFSGDSNVQEFKYHNNGTKQQTERVIHLRLGEE